MNRINRSQFNFILRSRQATKDLVRLVESALLPENGILRYAQDDIKGYVHIVDFKVAFGCLPQEEQRRLPRRRFSF